MVVKPVVLNWHREAFLDKERHSEIPVEALEILKAQAHIEKSEKVVEFKKKEKASE